jgi:hypothetical protein
LKPQLAGFAYMDEQFLKMLWTFLRPLAATQLAIEHAPRSAKVRKNVPLNKSTADKTELEKRALNPRRSSYRDGGGTERGMPHALRRKGSM